MSRVPGPFDRGELEPADAISRDPADAATLDPAAVAWGADGLVPAVVQDATDGTVLMLAWMDREALAATRATGLVHFHSRSRDRLWQKGETSGNVLRMSTLALDCDRDAILVTAHPAGPACHTGARSCFDGAPESRSEAPDAAAAPDPSETTAAAARDGGPASPRASGTGAPQGFASLERLWETIDERRAAADPGRSYTARLLAGGVDTCGRKVTEEATEVLLAARDDAEAERSRAADGERLRLRTALAGEVADLLYHVLVLCAERDLQPAEVLDVLRARRRP